MLPRFDLISVLILFGVFQTATMSAIFLATSQRSLRQLIGWILLTLTIIELESFLSYSGYIIHFPWFINLSPPLILLLGPLTLFLARKTHNPTQRLAGTFYWHLLPAVTFFAYSFFFYLQPTPFKVAAVLKSFHPEAVAQRIPQAFSVDPLHIRGAVIVEGLALHLLIYSALALLFLARRRSNTSDVHGDYLQWTKFWTGCTFAGSITFLLTGGVINGKVFFKPILPSYATDICCLVMAYACGMFWVARGLPMIKSVKYSKSGLDDQYQTGKLVLIGQLMKERKPFQNPNFSLSELATLVGVTTHQASQIINSGVGMSFTELVHYYRIREAVRVLEGPDREDIKVENLAYQLGYRSKSAFFKSFKRILSTTPDRFRKGLDSSSRSDTMRNLLNREPFPTDTRPLEKHTDEKVINSPPVSLCLSKQGSS